MRAFVASLLACVLLAGTGNSVAATVRGRVLLSAPSAPQSANLNPYAGTLGSLSRPSTPASAPAEQVVLTVRTRDGRPPSPAADAPGNRAVDYELAQRGQSFEPRVLAIPVGSTVAFPNFDPVFHNVFSYSRTKRFDLGRYGRGSSKSVTFDRPGLVKVFCDVHSNMSAFIYVADSPFVTQPRANGAFELEGLAPGRYQLVAWHPDLGERTYTIEVDGDEVELEIVF